MPILVQVNVARLDIHDDAIAVAAIGDDGLFVGPVRIHRVNTAGIQFGTEQAADSSFAAGCRS
jgi:hypothetical protein